MKSIIPALFVALVASTTGTALAVTGYVDNNERNIVRTGSGDCLHTQRWSEDNFVNECDAVIAAVEIVTRLRPITLESDALFEFDSAELTDGGKARLDEVMAGLQADSMQDQDLRITGYADRIGNEIYNQQLSERRAAAVQDYLISRGVSADHISSKGMGTANPVVGCDGIRGNALVECLAPNRRTEIEFSAMEVYQAEEVVEEVALPEK